MFGTPGPGTAAIRLRGTGNGSGADRLRVKGPATLAGETIKVFRLNARGKRVLVTVRTLNRYGDRPSIRVADENGRETTTYIVRLVGSERVTTFDTEPLTRH